MRVCASSINMFPSLFKSLPWYWVFRLFSVWCAVLPRPLSALIRESIRPYINVWSHYVWTVYGNCFVLAFLSVSFLYGLSFHNNFLLSLSFYSLSTVVCSAVLFMSLCLWILLCSFATFYPHYAVPLSLSSILTFFSFYITVSPE